MRQSVSSVETVSLFGVMLLLMGVGVIHYGLPPQIPVSASISLLLAWSAWRRYPWSDAMQGIEQGIQTGIIPMVIFLLVGALISVWIAAGVIPALMVWGFAIVQAQWFVPSVFIVCALVGSAVGSAFTVISTIGIAFLGMGLTMGLPPALAAGAILSGAIFGDKSSPLSESTNLTAAVVEADLFDHIRNLMWTTVPAFVISVLGYFILGLHEQTASVARVAQISQVLQQHFSIGIASAIPLILMFICARRHLPAIPTLLLNLAATIVLLKFQHPMLSVNKLASILQSGYVAHTNNHLVDQLLTRGGMDSMLSTIGLILVTLALGGLLVQLGLIDRAMSGLVAKLSSPTKLVGATLVAGIGVNIFVGEQFLSVILPGKAFKKLYQTMGLAPVALGRVLEDGGTVINYLIPWGVAGVFAANTLGVSTLAYLPFTFFSLVSPILSLVSAATGRGLKWQK